jgi:PEP-CTERM motif
MRLLISVSATSIRKTIYWMTLLCFIAFTPHARASVTYSVNFNGSTIDLTGFVTVNSLGSFTPTTFDANVIDYFVVASENGFGVFEFTPINSTWGGVGNIFAGQETGGNITINVLSDTIEMLAPLGGTFIVTNGFLTADVAVNGSRPNLRFAQNELAFRQPNPPDSTVSEFLPSSVFTLASNSQQIPEPSTWSLTGLSLAGLYFLRRRKKPAFSASF